MPSCPQFNLQFMVGSKPCSCCWQKTFCSYLKNCSAFPFCHSAGWKPLGEDSFIRGWKGSRTPHLQGFWSFCKAPPTGEGHGESSLRIPRSIIPKFLSGMCNEELDPTALTLRLLKWVRALRFNFLAFQCSSKLLRYLWANPPPTPKIWWCGDETMLSVCSGESQHWTQSHFTNAMLWISLAWD